MTDSSPSAFVLAHAKINLRLSILARETSGYHSIETIFHRLRLADDVRVTLAPASIKQVDCSIDVGPMEHNLAYRAANAYLAARNWDTGFVIDIIKRIPARGGLGGGSADAGAVLRALNTLHPNPLSPQALLHIAEGVGADVPFLTSDAPMALAWSRGERMLALDPLPMRWIALVIPDTGIATADAYGWVAQSRQSSAPSANAQELRPWHLSNWSELAPLVHNDFTAVVRERHPFVTPALDALRIHGAIVAEMSGSGSTIYGVFDTEPNAQELTRATGFPVIVTQTARTVETVLRHQR